MNSKGHIGTFRDCVLQGWVVTSEITPASLYINDDFISEITELKIRQDVIDAGITDKESGFSVDLSQEVLNYTGDITFYLKDGDTTLSSFKAYAPNTNNMIVNEFLELKDLHSIANFSIKTNHRVGLRISRFVAPDNVKHSNGYYTRLGFADINNTRHHVILKPEIKVEHAHTLKLSLTARASHDSNVHVILTNKIGKQVYNEPVLLSQSWGNFVVELDEDLTSGLVEKELSLSLSTKHHGRRFIDIAMIQLAESLVAPSHKVEEKRDKELPPQNVLMNGNLQNWPNGIQFKTLTRGQELAENWFVEMSKANLGKINVAAVTDNAQNDPLAKTLESSFGLRVRSSQLSGYARLIIPFNKQNLECLDYKFELEVAASGLANKVRLPRIYVIARDARNDAIVSDIIRKKIVNGRETIELKLDANVIESILSKSSNYPVLTIALDVDSNSDFTIYSANLMADTVDNDVQALVPDLDSDPTFIAFEDSSITEQLSVLKGLELWSTETTVLADSRIEKEKNTESNTLTLNHNNEFLAHIAALSPHKMKRPSRQFPFIDVIVPVYNACDDVLLCLSALIEKTDLLHRVIVINDGQDERTATMLSAFNDSFSHLEVVTNPENIGYTKSVNKGIKHANADWVVVLNSDTIVSEGWLGKLMNCAQSSDNVGMVGALSNAASWQSVPCIHDKNGDWHLNPLPENMTIDQMADKVAAFSERAYPEVGVINGFCQLINMEMLDKIGLLDEFAFPVGYGEENDMCARAVKGGFKLLIADDTYVFHAKSKSFGHSKRKELAKQGSLALKKKHPDVDWGQVTKKIYEHPSLVTLREQLATALSE